MKNLLFLTVCLSILIACSDDEEAPQPDIFEPVIISSDIVEDTRLEKINPTPGEADYIVSDYIDVEAILTIDPGVIIAFEANAGLFVYDVNTANGVITAIGNQTDPITFTGVQKTKGYWRGVAVESNDVRNELDNVVIEYAGSDFIATYGTNIKLKGGLAIEGVTGFNGSLKLKNTTIQNCDGFGLIVEEGTQLREFSNNSFADNTLAAVRINAENVSVLDAASNYVGNNGLDGVEINASGSPIHDVTTDATWPALSGGAVYRVEQSFDVRAELTFMPGTVIEFEANQTMVFKIDFSGPNDGIIIAKGDESNPIIFTGASKTPGYWRGIIIQSNSVLNEINQCIIEYGGSDAVAGQLANIGLDKDGAFNDPDLTVINSIIRHSAGCGIVVDQFGGNLTQSGNTFTDNVGLDICN